jgi:hypothetical protein
MKKVILIALTIMVVLSGCAGKSFTFKDAKKVELGDSGQQIISKMKGKPYMVKAVTDKEGRIVEHYIYTFVNGMTGTTKSVSFILTDGKATSIPTITDSVLNL